MLFRTLRRRFNGGLDFRMFPGISIEDMLKGRRYRGPQQTCARRERQEVHGRKVFALQIGSACIRSAFGGPRRGSTRVQTSS